MQAWEIVDADIRAKASKNQQGEYVSGAISKSVAGTNHKDLSTSLSAPHAVQLQNRVRQRFMTVTSMHHSKKYVICV